MPQMVFGPVIDRTMIGGAHCVKVSPTGSALPRSVTALPRRPGNRATPCGNAEAVTRTRCSPAQIMSANRARFALSE
jgi:hypothetical protein